MDKPYPSGIAKPVIVRALCLFYGKGNGFRRLTGDLGSAFLLPLLDDDNNPSASYLVPLSLAAWWIVSSLWLSLCLSALPAWFVASTWDLLVCNGLRVGVIYFSFCVIYLSTISRSFPTFSSVGRRAALNLPALTLYAKAFILT